MIEKEFKVVALRSSPDEGVDLELYPVFQIQAKPEEPLTPSPEQVIAGPAREPEEAKVVRQMTRAVVEEYAKAGLIPPPASSNTKMPPLFIPIIQLHLTKTEYEELKPSIGQTITLTVTIKGEIHE